MSGHNIERESSMSEELTGVAEVVQTGQPKTMSGQYGEYTQFRFKLRTQFLEDWFTWNKADGAQIKQGKRYFVKWTDNVSGGRTFHNIKSMDAIDFEPSETIETQARDQETKGPPLHSEEHTPFYNAGRERFVNNAMNRRTALMQAMELGIYAGQFVDSEEVHSLADVTARVLAEAERLYEWLSSSDKRRVASPDSNATASKDKDKEWRGPGDAINWTLKTYDGIAKTAKDICGIFSVSESKDLPWQDAESFKATVRSWAQSVGANQGQMEV